MSNRTARINRGTNDDTLGVAVYLSADELAQLGVDLDADRVKWQVDDGRLDFEEVRE